MSPGVNAGPITAGAESPVETGLENHCGLRTSPGVNVGRDTALRKPRGIPDLVLLDPPRFGIDKIEYMVGAPLVVVEIASPGDETYDKFPFYAGLGVPEVWVIHRDTRTPEIHLLGPARTYTVASAGDGGWIKSPGAGVEFRQTRPGKLWIRTGGDDSTATELPKD